MTPVRVLVVDDSVAARRLVKEALRPCPGVDVVATAGNGPSALTQIPTCEPDVVVLDVDMPGMDGMMTLRHIKERWPHLRVVMLSAYARSARTAAEAAAAGAAACVPKPSRVRDRAHALATTREHLEPHLRGPGHARPAPGRPPRTERPPAVPPPPAPPAVDGRPVRAVLIGSSTGGPEALTRVVPALPASLGVPVLVVQHMPAGFTAGLARRLDGLAAVPVVEAEDGMPAAPGRVHIAPGGRHLTVRQESGQVVLRLDDGLPVNAYRPAVDVLLQSAARVWGSRTLTVVLTGMGSDGLEGARMLRALGGRVIAQDAGTSVVWGMPGAVAKAGLARQVLPLGDIAAAVAAAATAG